MSSSTNYNSIINKSLNRQRLKPSKYLTHKIKKLQKNETPVKKEEHKEVSKSPSIHPSITSSVSQFKDNPILFQLPNQLIIFHQVKVFQQLQSELILNLLIHFNLL